MDIDIERHLIKALIELDLVRDDLLYRKDYRNASLIGDYINNILKYSKDLKKTWNEEKEKWK